VLAATTLFLGGPLAVLAVESFRVGGSWSLAAYRSLGSSASTDTLFVSASDALVTSLRFAALAACIAVVVGGLASVVIASRPGRATRTMDTLLMLPLGTSAVTVGFGFLVALDRWPLDLRAKAILVPIAQAVVAIPFVIRAVVPALRSIDSDCAMPPPCSAPRLGAYGKRWISRSRCVRSVSASASRLRCRSGSSARRCSSLGPTRRPIPIAISRSWRGRAR
jgi:ABC-type spermidine/putrescine transport system permease subunit II